jgi:hypothetical protein
VIIAAPPGRFENKGIIRFDRRSADLNSPEGKIMSHMSHIANPGFLVYPLYVPQTKTKPEPKTVRTGDWIEGYAVREANHDRDTDERNSEGRESEARDSDSESSGDGRGIDLTI